MAYIRETGRNKLGVPKFNLVFVIQGQNKKCVKVLARDRQHAEEIATELETLIHKEKMKLISKKALTDGEIAQIETVLKDEVRLYNRC